MSNAVILSIPLLPSLRLVQNVSRSLPTGVTTPIPVITTRRSLFMRRIVKSSARSHADALHRLEKLAFGFDRWRDDNFGLLKLRDIFCADVTHASGDGADEILTAVINFGRAEENLSQRTGCADFDPRSAGKIHV